MENVREWLTALTAPAIAMLGIWIAYRQFRVQEYRVRIDLYEKRFAVFTAARELLLIVATTRRPPIEGLDKFSLCTVEAPFLFGPDIEKYLHELQNKYLAIWNGSEQQTEEGFADSQEKQDHLKKQRELRESMRGQLREVQSIFGKYLNLSVL